MPSEQHVEHGGADYPRPFPVYYGFLLTSDEYHMLVFRGTQRRFESAGRPV